MMAWDYASRLYNAELNVRWNPCARITMLAGFRWVNLSEDLQGTLPPAAGGAFLGYQRRATISMVSRSARMESYSSVAAFRWTGW